MALGVVICTGIWAYNFVNGPVVAGAAMIDPEKPEATPVPQPRLLQGLYMQLEYPEQFDLLSRLSTDSTALEQYNVGMSTKRQVTLAISVRPLPSGQLEDDSSWLIRSKDKAGYQPNTEKLQGETVSIMTKSDNTEKTIFWVHEGKLLIMALSTNDPNDDLPTILASIKPSIRWRS